MNALSHLLWLSTLSHALLAQQDNFDFWANVPKIWSNLIQTGQLWAFLIGVGVGWWVRNVLP